MLERFHQPGKAMPMNLSNTARLTCVHRTKRQILATLAVKLRFVPRLSGQIRNLPRSTQPLIGGFTDGNQESAGQSHA
jgi:hypothetical protein